MGKNQGICATIEPSRLMLPRQEKIGKKRDTFSFDLKKGKVKAFSYFMMHLYVCPITEREREEKRGEVILGLDCGEQEEKKRDAFR